MIEVTEGKETKTFATADEALERLSKFYGRVLRIRRVGPDPSYHEKIVDRTSIGEFRSLSVSTNYRRDNEGSMHRYDSNFAIALGNEDAIRLMLAESTIEVLQEDSGKWILIHRGTAFEHHLERISK